MNTMNMPGYTAEASLYRASGHYPAKAGTPEALVDGRGVLPQLPRQLSLLLCLENCADFDSSPNCRDSCFQDSDSTEGDGGGDGGGGGLYCTPQCGPCYADSDSSTGGFRTCRYANCDTYDKPCRVIVRPPHGRIWNVGQL